MLSEYLTSSYLQYKQDINAVATWLATTAEKSFDSQCTDAIAIKSFINLAESIANHRKPPVRVPKSFVSAITRAISVRRNHGQSVPRQDKKSDERHGYFIGVLEDVYELMRPLMPTEALRTTKITTAVTNRFEDLDVQEPSEQFLNAPDAAPATPTRPTEANYEAEMLQDTEEAFLAFRLLVEDYNKFQNVIIETWQAYQHGIFDLVSASLTTNTALDLARRMEEDVKPLFDKCGSVERMLHLYFIALCIDCGEDKAFKERPEDEMNFRMHETSLNIYWPTYLFMQAFIGIVHSDVRPEYKPGFYGIYDPSSDRTKMTPREKFKEDKILLAEFLPEVSLLCWGLGNINEEDEFIRGLRIAFKTHKIPLSLVFAGQVFLDIHHILREGLSRGFADLQNIAQGIDSSIRSTLKFHTSLRVDTWPRSNDQVMKMLQGMANNWVRYDPLVEVKQKLKRRAEPFVLMKSHPLFCGLYAYSLKVQFQEVSTVFVNAWGSILYTYHLYNACRQEGLLQGNWKDMDLLMGMQGDRVFVGDKPAKPEDYLKRYALSMGYSAAIFAKDRRNGSLPASKAGPRGLKTLAPAAQMFKKRFCSGSGQVDWSLEDVQKIVSQAEREEEELAENLLELRLERTVKRPPSAPAKKSTTPATQLSATQLLRRLRNTLQGETLEFNIDYLIFHQICWSILRKLNEILKQGLREMFGAGYLEKENQLPWIVGYVFLAATNAKRVGKLLIPKKSDVVTSKMLVKAADESKSFIDSGSGGAVCALLEVRHNIGVADDDESDTESVDEQVFDMGQLEF